MNKECKTCRDVARYFAIDGEFMDAERYGTGHINDTFRAGWRMNGSVRHYILQRINHNVFKNPPAVMENIKRVTEHLRSRLVADGGDAERETLTIVPTRNGCSFHLDPDGNYWRCYIFIRDASTYDVCQGPAQASEAAAAFGRFQRMLADLSGPRLNETIPFFHHTPRRFQALEQAISADAVNRCASAKPEIDFAMARKTEVSRVVDLIARGSIPERITHNDTKINNVMMDNATGRGVCVIDLDTVMAGCALYDFGDMVRTMTRLAAEDERDLAKVNMDICLFEAVARGYIESIGDMFVPAERDLLSFAGRLITFTIGIRFLTDYLSGDVYFKTHRPGQNLDRARVQFKMVESMESQEREMERVVARTFENMSSREVQR